MRARLPIVRGSDASVGYQGSDSAFFMRFVPIIGIAVIAVALGSALGLDKYDRLHNKGIKKIFS